LRPQPPHRRECEQKPRPATLAAKLRVSHNLEGLAINQPSRHQGTPRLSNTASAHPPPLPSRLFLFRPQASRFARACVQSQCPLVQPARATEAGRGGAELRAKAARRVVTQRPSFPQTSPESKGGTKQNLLSQPVTARRLPPDSSPRDGLGLDLDFLYWTFCGGTVARGRKTFDHRPRVVEPLAQSRKKNSAISQLRARWTPDNNNNRPSFRSRGTLPRPLVARVFQARSRRVNSHTQMPRRTRPRPLRPTPTCTRESPPTHRLIILPDSTLPSPAPCRLRHTRGTRALRRSRPARQ